MTTNMITMRFSPEDLDHLRSALGAACYYYHEVADIHLGEEDGVAENMSVNIDIARRLRDATLSAQYPDDPTKRPLTQKEKLARQQELREHWLPILERYATRELMSFRVGCHATSGNWAQDDWQKSYGIISNNGPQCPLALIKEVLATREHIPNKEERKEARRQKTKAGRQRGRGDR